MKNSKIEFSQVSHKKRYFVFFCLIVCLTLNVILSVNISSSGQVMAELEKEINKTKQVQKDLRYKLISSTSLLKIEDYAASHGFVKPTEIVYVKDGLYGLAKLPDR